MTNRNEKSGNTVASCELRAAKSSPCGFTLIEMITVLSIIIIVLAIALPVWRTLLGGTNLSAAQNEISATIANARADAIYNRQTIGVFFFIDPKTQQTGMAEVQVQTLYQPHPTPTPPATPIFTSSFIPGQWAAGSGWTPYNNTNPSVNSIERVNSPDPNTAGNFIFYRDVTLLPKGVGIALNNNTYNYNIYNQWGNNNATTIGPVDRYVRYGCIMFNPDGTLASINYGIPYYEWFNSTSYGGGMPGANNESQLCKAIGMWAPADTGSLYNTAGSTPAAVPLTSSVGLVVFDHDAYINQHANATAVVTTADGAQFNDFDMNYIITGAPTGAAPLVNSGDKFLEEQWIDQNGTALLVSPFNGSLIKAK
jgi:prepilin-type N-terminal cleavage/methylation domain-containing protein